MTKVQDILVYTDFTEVSEKSLKWAIFLAKKFKKNIYLVHVINENSYIYFDKSNVHSEAEEALKFFCDDIYKTHGVSCKYYLEQGCTCTIINSTAERIDAFIIVLGTHGKNDPQFLSGLSLVKIIHKSRIPYFVVQKNSKIPDDSKNIIVPIDIKKEGKEKTGWVSYFAQHINSKVEILFNKSDDERQKNNIFFCTKFFNELNIKYEKCEIQNSYLKSLNSQSIRYASEYDGLLVVVTTTKNPNFYNKIFGFPETKIISNSFGIPVLCINPQKDLYIPCI